MRITNVKEVEQKVIAGGEPSFTEEGMSLTKALNWYSYYRDYKDSKKYLLHYMQVNKYPKKDIELVSKINDSTISNVGFVCRIVERGGKLDEKHVQWVKNKINSFKSLASEIREESKEEPVVKVNIQDRIAEQTSEFIGELEGFLDNWKVPFNPYEWMSSNGVKAVHARKIQTWFSGQYKEPESVLLNQADDELKEAYSHFNKTELKKYLAFIQNIISDAGKIVHNSKVTRKPRKVKKPSADKLAAKVQYKKDDVEYKIVSINPTEIVGSKQLWVFNTKTRKLGVYHAESVDGLTIKGTSIHGYITSKSCSKTLRKPNDVLSTLTKATERKYSTIFGGIKAAEQELTGRLNSDTILLKVFK